MEERAGRAFEEAARFLGLRVTPFAELMQSRGYTIDPSAARRWVRLKGRGMPAWALLAAADVAGVTSSDLIGERTTSDTDRLHEEFATLASSVARLEEELASRPPAGAAPHVEEGPGRIESLEKRMGDLEHEIGLQATRRIAEETRRRGTGS